MEFCVPGHFHCAEIHENRNWEKLNDWGYKQCGSGSKRKKYFIHHATQSRRASSKVITKVAFTKIVELMKKHRFYSILMLRVSKFVCIRLCSFRSPHCILMRKLCASLMWRNAIQAIVLSQREYKRDIDLKIFFGSFI